MGRSPHFLVVDGYTREARDELAAGGACIAAHLYRDMLEKLAPQGSTFDLLFPSDPGCELPKGVALESYDGVAWTGCSLCINDESPEVQEQIGLARACFESGIPAFGSCWAAQIAVVAAGGRVEPNPRGREMGVARKIVLNEAGRAHPLYRDKPVVFDAFTSHDDEVVGLPAGGVALGGNKWTRIQSVVVEQNGTSFWGLQYHPEYNLHEMARLTWCRTDKLISIGCYQDRAQVEAHVADMEALHADPRRRDIAWRLGLDDDILSGEIRTLEVRNWIEQVVLPGIGS